MKQFISDLESLGAKVTIENNSLIRINGELFATNNGILEEMRKRKGDYEKFVKLMSKGVSILKTEDKPSCFQ